MALTSIQQFKRLMTRSLSSLYSPEEILSLSRLALEAILEISGTRLLLRDDALTPEQGLQLEELAQRLSKAEPIQYLLGHTMFYDLKIKVSPAVLIPRPETEELVHWILNDEQVNREHILDVGTGSGCIALALKKHLPASSVVAWDISEEALELARQNDRDHQAGIQFRHIDVLSYKPAGDKFTCIVSNPPYVRQLEKEMMTHNVLGYEPHLALFVENDDPLIFYRTIAGLGLRILSAAGSLFFEINEYLEDEMTRMLTQLGYTRIECRKDLQGKARMMKAMRPA